MYSKTVSRGECRLMKVMKYGVKLDFVSERTIKDHYHHKIKGVTC